MQNEHKILATMTAKKVKTFFKDLLKTNRLSVTTGKSNHPYIRLSTWGSGEIIPNEYRQIAVECIGSLDNVVNVENISYGNIGEKSISMHTAEWLTFLERAERKYYGIIV